MNKPPLAEILIESIQYGSSLRILAVDPETGLEVTFQAPLTAGTHEINRIARSKLSYVLAKQAKK